MPCFHVHDLTEIYMRNILAFEGCHISDRDSAYISQYLTILDFLTITEKDVSILVDKKIIVNWMGDANLVATMVNNLCKNVSMPTLNSKYLSLCHRLNDFYENPRNKYQAHAISMQKQVAKIYYWNDIDFSFKIFSIHDTCMISKVSR